MALNTQKSYLQAKRNGLYPTKATGFVQDKNEPSCEVPPSNASITIFF